MNKYFLQQKIFLTKKIQSKFVFVQKIVSDQKFLCNKYFFDQEFFLSKNLYPNFLDLIKLLKILEKHLIDMDLVQINTHIDIQF